MSDRPSTPLWYCLLRDRVAMSNIALVIAVVGCVAVASGIVGDGYAIIALWPAVIAVTLAINGYPKKWPVISGSASEKGGDLRLEDPSSRREAS